MTSMAGMAFAEPLAHSRRLVVNAPGAAQGTFAQVLCLASVGALTALARALVDLSLGIPGHSIVLVVVPLAFGLVCVPRRGAGAILGGSALTTVLALRLVGLRGTGAGATVSLAVTAVAPEAAPDVRLATE